MKGSCFPDWECDQIGTEEGLLWDNDVQRQCGISYKTSRACNREETIIEKLSSWSSNIDDCIFINSMDIFTSGHVFMVTTTAITGAISTGTITVSYAVTIASTTTMTNPNISSISTMDTRIGVLQLMKVRAEIINTKFIAFVSIKTERVASIIYTLIMGYLSFRNKNVTTFFDKFYVLIMKIPTNPTGLYLTEALKLFIRQGSLI